MKKAKFVCKWYGRGFDRDSVYLEYEYRGQTYVVYENRAKGNEPLSWQHVNAQAAIDHDVEVEEKLKKFNESGKSESWEVGFNAFWDFVEGDGEQIKTVEQMRKDGYPLKIMDSDGHEAVLVDCQPLFEGYLAIYRFPRGERCIELYDIRYFTIIER